MQRESEEPVRALRASVAKERTILEELERRFNHPSMKTLIRHALFDLDDVEAVFLSRLDEGLRTAPEEAAVIDYACVPYEWAIAKRKHIQETMAKYGADAMLVPWP